MTDITLRGTKGAPLTHQELDDNFANLKETADLAYSASAAIGGKANSSAVGVDDSATTMGTTPGTILSDNGTAKTWFQELEADAVNRAETNLSNVTLDGSAMTITTTSGGSGAHVGEKILATNSSETGQYAIRFAFLHKTANFSDGINEIGDTLIARYDNIGNGTVWGRWNVVMSPLNPASGLPTAPSNAQSFRVVVGEDNPQNRYGNVGWSPLRRTHDHYAGGWQMVAETQDFTSQLGGARPGYNCSFGYMIGASQFTSTLTDRHARFYNGILIEPNGIAPGGYVVFAAGHRSFPTAVAISAAGSGYTAGDRLSFNTGLDQGANQNTIVEVTSVNGSGGIIGARLSEAGWYNQTFASPIGVTGGTGTGAQFTYTLSDDNETPRAWGGMAGRWNYGLDGCPSPGAGSGNVGYADFTGAMVRSPNNTTVICGRNAANSADLPGLKINASDRWELAGKEIKTWADWTPTISSDGGAFTSVSINAGATRYQKINGKVTAHVSFQVVTVGSASGAFLISLPEAPAQQIMVIGQDASNARMMGGALSGANARVARYDGTTPIVAGAYYYATFIYEVA